MRTTREQWLNSLVKELRPIFKARGCALPRKIRISVGWPVGNARKIIGQCFYTGASADDTHELFISPMLGDPLRVADIVVHELCHAAIGPGHGHGALFAKIMRQLDLGGKPTETVATPELLEWLRPIVKGLGKYPHAALQPTAGKKQGTRMLKASCPMCGYTVRLTRKWADIATIVCPVDDQLFVVDW